MPRIPARHGDISSNRYSVFKSRRYVQETDNVAIVQLARQPILIERKFILFAHVMIVDPLHYRVLPGYGVRQTTGIADYFCERAVLSKFENRRIAYAARQSHQLSHWRNIDHIARLQLRVLGFIAIHDQIIKIESADNFAVALQLNAAHRASFRWPARSK